MAYGKSTTVKDPVIQYVANHSLRLHPVQKELIEESKSHRFFMMLGAPEALQLNANLMQLIGAKRVLDIGTYTGESALVAALALPPDGEVHTMDVTDEFVDQIGRKYWKKAGVEEKIHFHVRPALETLDSFITEGQDGKFDFAFIDADKGNYTNYYNRCFQLVRSGGIIAVDNTLWSGNVANKNDQTEDTEGIRKLNDLVRDDLRINLSFLSIADGLTLCFKK